MRYKGGRHPITDEKIELLFSAFASGVPSGAAAAEIGTSRNTAVNYYGKFRKREQTIMQEIIESHCHKIAL